MRKFYSFVLMATMLLMGTNAWADDPTSFAELKSAFTTASSGDVIQLGGDIEFGADDVIWLGTACISDAPKSITLDLNGHDITRNVNGSSTAYHFFVITHGELLVINSGADATIGFAEGSKTGDLSTIFSVYGSYLPCENFTHLEIAENVKLSLPAGCLGTAIAIDVVSKGTTRSNGIPYWASAGAIKYTTNLLSNASGSSYGYAFGVTVDVKCDIYSMGGTSGKQKAYGIKANGNLESAQATCTFVAPDYTAARYSCMSADQFVGYAPSDDYAPFIHVYPSSSITTSNGSTKSAAVYASGYAKWLIEGECQGNIGVYVSSGDVDIDGATIASTADSYAAPGAGSSVSGSGSAIVINSRNGYTGYTDVTITGKTEISAVAGYAIEEKVNTSNGDNKVEEISIESAEITGGGKGAIIVTDGTVDETSIYAADINGSITIDDGSENPQPVNTEEDKSLGGLVKAETITSSKTDEDADYYVAPEQKGGKTVIVVEPNTSKVVIMNNFGFATFSAGVARQIINGSESNDGLKVYYANSTVETSEDVVLKLTEITGPAATGAVIPANTGVIFMGQAGKTYSLGTNESTDGPLENNLLKPSSAWANPITYDENGYIVGEAKEYAYVLSGKLLYKYTGSKMKVNKAYLDLANEATPYGAPARVRMVIAEPQAVENVATEAVKAQKFIENGQVFIKRGEKVYNVQGQIVK